MLTEALAHVRDDLIAAGLNAAIDPRDLRLPGVWVTVDRYKANRLSGTAAGIRVKLLLIAPDQGHAIEDLDQLVATVSTGYPIEFEAAVVALPNHAPDPLPALVGTFDISATRED